MGKQLTPSLCIRCNTTAIQFLKKKTGNNKIKEALKINAMDPEELMNLKRDLK